jgi:hypothetical protein
VAGRLVGARGAAPPDMTTPVPPRGRLRHVGVAEEGAPLV